MYRNHFIKHGLFMPRYVRFSDGGAQPAAGPADTPASSTVTEPVNPRGAAPANGDPDAQPASGDAEKTYTRSDVDRIIAAETKKALDNYQVQLQQQQDEATKLSSMKADEKAEYERDKALKEAESAVRELNAYRLKDTAIKIAMEKALPVEFLDLIDFKATDAEKVNSTIDSLTTAFKSAVEKTINEKLKQPPPKSATGGNTISRGAQYAAQYSAQFNKE